MLPLALSTDISRSSNFDYSLFLSHISLASPRMKPTSEWTHVPAPAAPIDPSYKPKRSIVTVPAAASVDYILGVIARDGGVIISDLVSKDKIATIEEELKAWQENQPTQSSNDPRSGDAFHIIPSQTTLIPGLVGKSDTVSEICEHPLLDSLRENILLEKYTVYREDWVEPIRIDPLLSLSLSMNIGYGAPRQRLHRDDNIHRIRHSGPEEWSFECVSQFGCLIAGCDVTRENGATMFVPGSHKWNDHRMATADEVCFAGKRRVLQSLNAKIANFLLLVNRDESRFRFDLSRIGFPRRRPQLCPKFNSHYV